MNECDQGGDGVSGRNVEKNLIILKFSVYVTSCLLIKVSATSYTLIGVLNKCATVLVNLMIWDQHASPVGIASLFVCLVGGTFYQQAPYRKTDGDSTMKAQADKDLEASNGKPEMMDPLLKK